MPSDARILAATAARALRPDSLLSLVDWADTHRMVSGRAAAEPGRWRTARTPYLAEIMRQLDVTSPVRRVIVMKGAQLGLTEVAMNWLGYTIDQSPGPFLFVQPTVELAKRLSRQRLEPTIAETPVLRARVRPMRSRDASNTTLLKEFDGGLVVLTGANSAAGLRSLSARYLCFDEIDGYPGDVEGEGDPLGLAEARARTFARRKVLILSTPKIAGVSRIEREYLATDQRRYLVPCPHCGTAQPLEFSGLVWTRGRPDTVAYRCAACAAAIGEEHKGAMLAAGVWRATAPSTDPLVVGYHLSALYAPLGWLSWAEIARAAEDAARDPTLQKNFDNTILGIAYAERGEAPDWKRLRDRQTRGVRGRVPAGVRFLTMGVDVQTDRLEASVWGWGRGRRSWLVDHVVLEGDTAGEVPWVGLSELVARTYPAAGGRLAMPIARVAVDTGYLPTSVHAWARRIPAGRVVLVRGGGASVAMVSLPRAAEAVDTRGTTKRRRPRRVLRVWSVDTHAVKLETYAWLSLASPEDGVSYPAGWIALPAVGDEFLRQLTAEQLVRKIVAGVERHVWVKVYNRNEALDCRCYARAAAHLVGLDRFTDDDWAKLDEPFAALTADELADEGADMGAPAPAAAASFAGAKPEPPAAAASSTPAAAPESAPSRAPGSPAVVPLPDAAPRAPRWRSSEFWDRDRR